MEKWESLHSLSLQSSWKVYLPEPRSRYWAGADLQRVPCNSAERFTALLLIFYFLIQMYRIAVSLTPYFLPKLHLLGGWGCDNSSIISSLRFFVSFACVFPDILLIHISLYLRKSHILYLQLLHVQFSNITCKQYFSLHVLHYFEKIILFNLLI